MIMRLESRCIWVSGGPVDKNFESLGLELTTDIHLAQIFFPFNLGGSFIWIPETGSTQGGIHFFD